MILDWLIYIHIIVNNIFYGAMVLVSIFLLVTNKKELSSIDIIIREEKEEWPPITLNFNYYFGF